MSKKIYPLLTFALLFFLLANAQIPQGKSSKPFFGQPGIKKSISALRVSSSTNFRKKAAGSTLVKPYMSYLKKYDHSNRAVRGNGVINLPARGNGSQAKNATAILPDPATAATGSTQQIWSNFLSIDFYENPIGWPPDPNGSVGKSQVIVASNNGLKVHEKHRVTDPPLLTPNRTSGKDDDGDLFISLEDFFSPVLPWGSGISDPHIRYDRLSNRWIVVAIEVNPTLENNLVLLAISDGDKITESANFTFYSFNSSLFPYDPFAPYAPFFDYPTLGADKNSIVIGGNQFGYDSLTNVGYVIDKKKLLQGELVVYPFELGVLNFVYGTVGGMYTPSAVYNDDPSGKKTFFTGITYFQDGLVVSSIDYYKNQPWLSSEITIPVEPFASPRDNSHPGSLIPLDVNDTRLLEAAIHTNKITGKSSLWTAHAIGVGKTGHIIWGTDSDFVKFGRTGSRWYEIGDIYSKPGLSQVGTLVDWEQNSGRKAVQYFNPSIAASGQGHAVLAGTTDAFNEYLNVFVAGRYNGEQDGTLHAPVKATETHAVYAPYIDLGGGNHLYVDRWGDFSETAVDPEDDQTIWTFQEYANLDDSYGVRAVQIKAPPPAAPKALGTLSNKKDTVITLKGMSVDNSGFFDPGKDKGGPGYNRLSVKSTGNVGVSDVRFMSPTKISFKLNTKNKPAGDYFLVITNPDGQVTVAAYKLDGKGEIPMLNSRQASVVDAAELTALKFVVTSDVYPNPTRGQFKLLVNAANLFNGKVLLLTAGGETISASSFSFNKGSNNVALSLGNLGSGNYIAAVYNENNILVAVHKVIKE